MIGFVSTSPARVVLFGFGLAGEFFHAPFITSHPDLSLAAVVTSDPERAARAAALGAAVVTNADDVWSDPSRFDLAVVATANVAHVPLARRALESGLHVVVDKPLAPTADVARELRDLAVATGKGLHVFQNRRWDSDFLTLRRLQANGLLGDILRLESRFERWRPQPKGGWRESASPDQMGGLLYDIGAHLVDQALVLLGPVATVYAQAQSVRDPQGPDDHTFIALTHRGGATSHLSASVMAAISGPRLRVLGTRGAFSVTGLDSQEDVLREGFSPATRSPWGVESPDRRGTFVDIDGVADLVDSERGRWDVFYEQVAGAVRGEGDGPVPVDGVIAALTVLDAARESAGSGQVVALP